MAPMADTQAYLGEIRRVRALGPESGPVPPVAGLGMRRFEEVGLPTRRLEDWRYTDLRPLNGDLFRTGLSEVPGGKVSLPERITDWPRLVLINGRVMPGLSDNVASDALTVLSASELIDRPPEGVDPGLFTKTGDEDGIEALNAALSGDGLGLIVAAGEREAKLELVLLFEGAADEAVHQRNLFVLREHATFSLCLSVKGSGRLGWINLVNQFIALPNSRLEVHQEFDAGESRLVTAVDTLTMMEGALAQHHSFKAGTSNLRHLVRSNLCEKGARVVLNGVAMAGRDQSVASVTETRHISPEASSEQHFRNLATANGTVSFLGRVEVFKEAQGTKADQTCKSLLLGEAATANTKPELLIYADNVKCSHGAATGQLDEAALFYLSQRGIPKDEAKAMLVEAFLSDVLERMPLDLFRNHCRERLGRSLAGRGEVEK